MAITEAEAPMATDPSLKGSKTGKTGSVDIFGLHLALIRVCTTG